MVAGRLGIHLKRAGGVRAVRINGVGLRACAALNGRCTMIGTKGKIRNRVNNLSTDNTVKLREITDVLLFETENYGKLLEAATALYQLLLAAAEFDGDSAQTKNGSQICLPTGKAISPTDAARCILDFARTCAFLKGIHAALQTLEKRSADSPVEILYAGCGPLAPFAVPFCLYFDAGKIRFTLLDVHEESLDASQRIFKFFGFENRVRAFVCADAAIYKSEKTFQLIVAETMQKALDKEPQVAVTANLAAQIAPGGFFIPERIFVEAFLCDVGKEFDSRQERSRIPIGRIFDLSAADIFDLENFPKIVVEIPPGVPENLDLMLTTHVNVFGAIKLGDYDSGITYPKILFDLGKQKSGTKIEFQYQVSENPGFRYRIL